MSERVASSGAKRDNREGKGRYDLLPPFALACLARHFERGAAHYGDRNWEKGQPISWYLDSGLRHATQLQTLLRTGADWYDPEVKEAVTAAAWNFLALLDTHVRVGIGLLPTELLDLPNLDPPELTQQKVDIR